MNKHIICLTQEQRQSLEHMVKAGKTPARQILHAQILLKVDAGENGPNWSNKQIQEAFGAVESTIWRVRTRFLQAGLEASVERRPQPDRPEQRKLAGEQEAHLIALACQQPPDGRECWTLRLLADKLVELDVASAMKACEPRLKKRTQALAKGAVVHSAQGQCGLCRGHGGRAECLPTALRCSVSAGLLG